MQKLIEIIEEFISKNTFLFLFFFIFLIFKLLYQVPLLSDGGDEAGQWFLALDIMNGEYGRLDSLHHNLRWANWLPSILIGIFNDSYQGYYIFNFIRSSIGFLIFFYIISKSFSPLVSIVFLILIFFDHDLMHFYFELNPDMTAIFYLSLIFFFIYIKNDKSFEGINLFIIILLFFFLYGAKLPFIFFFLGFVIFILKLKGRKVFIKSIMYFIILYVIETSIFNFFNSDFSNLGRIYEIAFNKTVHINSMYDHFPDGMSLTYIFERWLVNRNSIAYILGILMLCIIYGGKFKETKFLEKDIIKNLLFYLGLTFFICNTFFIISINPFMMGQEHHSRYVAQLIFFIFPFIIYLFRYLVINSKIIFFPFYVVIFILIFYPQFSYIYQFLNHGKISNYKSISYQLKKYDKYSKIVKSEKCFQSNKIEKASRLAVSLNYFERNNFNIFFDDEKWLAKKIGYEECKNYFILDEMYENN